MSKKILALVLAMLLALTGAAFAEEAEPEYGDIVVLYTNDVHCGVNDVIGYAGLAAYKKAYEANGFDTALVDIGDAIQGDTIGTLSTGEYLVDIMNYVGYDVAIPGNHEFDYSLERFLELTGKAEYKYLCSNLTDLEGNPVLDAYTIVELGGRKVGFVGVTTPKTFTTSTPVYFQNEAGEFIYSFCQGNDGADLYAAVQSAVDAARAEGAELVILLSHLGIEADCAPWMSTDVILNTNGIDVVLDGHSHSTIEQEIVLNKDGEEVLMTSTGTKLNAVGVLTIAADGTISSALHTESLFQDAETAEFISGIEAQFEEVVNTVVAHSDIDLVVNDPETDVRLVRNNETNLGDLCADAYLVAGGAQIGIVNGGGVRAKLAAGDITYGDIIKVHPFGNELCVISAKGQVILDALEKSVSAMPGEQGGFLQVSGLTFDVDMNVESTVVTDDEGLFVEVSGDRRVSNVMVGGEALDPEAEYIVAGTNYTLMNSGDGYSMFADSPVLRVGDMLDNQVLIDYITNVLGGTIGEEYADPYGAGRINIIPAE